MAAQYPLRTLRREQVLNKTGLGRTTQYNLEKNGDFPARFLISPRCAVWYEHEVDAWLEARRAAALAAVPGPDVRLRKTNPVRGAAA
jgi:prophage regulatory protein